MNFANNEKNENSQSSKGAGYPSMAQRVFNVCDNPHDNGKLMQNNPTTASRKVSQTNKKAFFSSSYFMNNKKNGLAKADKSKKGDIDTKVISLLETINALPDYYTTSSCSGRVYLWKGTGKKSETSWIRVSHDLIEEDFFEMDEKDVVWLRLEGVILHVACKDLEAAYALLEKARKFYKKSCILSVSTKIIVEIRGSEFMEMPLYKDGKLLFSGDLKWLKEIINQKLEKMWKDMEKFRKSL